MNIDAKNEFMETLKDTFLKRLDFCLDAYMRLGKERDIADFAVLMKMVETRAADTCKNEKYQELYTLSAKVSAAEQLVILNWDNIFAE